MTVFLGHPVLTTVAPLVSSDKGSLGNRVNCVASQTMNVATTAVTTAGAAVATIAGAEYAYKHSKQISAFANKLKGVCDKLGISKLAQKAKKGIAAAFNKLGSTKIGQKIGNVLKNPVWSKVGNHLKQIATKMQSIYSSLPTGGKMAIGLLLGFLALNGVYKSGQIDQKYTDRAKMEKHFV